VQAIPRYTTVEDYLNSEVQVDGHYEYANGELIPIVPENIFNDAIAIALQIFLINNGFFRLLLVKAHSCEIEVEIFHGQDKETRIPDLVVLKAEHITLTQRKLTIRKNMPSPLLVAEVVSPYESTKDRNYQQDYIRKSYQYSARGIPEYWIIDPQNQVVIVRSSPSSRDYTKSQDFRGADLVKSHLPELIDMHLTAKQILEPQT